MLRKVPDEFDFFVKAHRDLTHVRRNAEATLPRFQEMLKAYERDRKLAGTLFAFRRILNAATSMKIISDGSWND